MQAHSASEHKDKKPGRSSRHPYTVKDSHLLQSLGEALQQPQSKAFTRLEDE